MVLFILFCIGCFIFYVVRNRRKKTNQVKAKISKIEQQLAAAKEEASIELEALQAQQDENYTKYAAAITNWTEQINTVRTQYLAVLDALNEEETNKVKNYLQIPEESKTDIKFLLSEVAPRFNNKNTIYKLIWSEYFQTPTKDLLSRILPNATCSGIYKITNPKNKKCYIGRSTDVKRRLTDHIKSAIGIETISNQKIHDVMREEGIWNFSFELLEACEKDQLGDREKYYINFFKSDNANYGYNAIGGSAFKTLKEE